MASGLNSTFRLLGIAIGVAALGALLESRVTEKLSELLPGSSGGLADIVSTGNVEAAAAAAAPRGSEAQVTEAARIAFISGVDAIFVAAAVIAFTGAALALLLVRQRDLAPAQAAPAAAG